MLRLEPVSFMTPEIEQSILALLNRCKAKELALRQDAANDNNAPSFGVGAMKLAQDLVKVPTLHSLRLRGQPGLTFLLCALSFQPHRITKLDLGSFSSVQDLRFALANATGLEDLTLTGCDLQAGKLGHVLDSLNHCSLLKRLIFGFQCILPESLDPLAPFVAKQKMLETLEIDVFREKQAGYDATLLVDAIVAHPNIRNVNVPLQMSQTDLALSLMNHCANRRTSYEFETSIVWMMRKEQNPDSPQENPASCLQFSFLTHNRADCSRRLFEAVQHFGNHLTDLYTRHNQFHFFPMVNWITDLFQQRSCRVSNLDIGELLTERQSVELASGLHRYPHLKDLSLCIQSVAGIASLCRPSSLETASFEFHLPVTGRAASDCVTEILNHHQKSLKCLHLSLVDCQSFDISQAMKNNDTLSELYISTIRIGDAVAILNDWRQGLFCHLPRLLRALEHNKTLHILDISRAAVDIDNVLRAVEWGALSFKPIKHLQRLILSAESLGGLIHADNGAEMNPNQSGLVLDQLALALKDNTSLLCLHECSSGRDVCPFCQHQGLCGILHRNKLWNKAREVAALESPCTIGLHSHILAKLGSNSTGDGTPLFHMLRGAAASVVFVGVLTKRKRQ